MNEEEYEKMKNEIENDIIGKIAKILMEEKRYSHIDYRERGGWETAYTIAKLLVDSLNNEELSKELKDIEDVDKGKWDKIWLEVKNSHNDKEEEDDFMDTMSKDILNEQKENLKKLLEKRD